MIFISVLDSSVLYLYEPTINIFRHHSQSRPSPGIGKELEAGKYPGVPDLVKAWRSCSQNTGSGPGRHGHSWHQCVSTAYLSPVVQHWETKRGPLRRG